jgi:uncharacterized membrane protein
MRIVGVLVVLAGWLLPVLGLGITHSTAARFVLVIVGIGISLIGILGVLNKAHVKDAVWKA